MGKVLTLTGGHVHPAEIRAQVDRKAIEGLKVVFINMPLRESARPTAMPEGPLLLATNLRQNYGVDASVIDLNAYRIVDELSQKRELATGRHLTHKEAFDLIAMHFSVHGTPDLVGLSGLITTLRWQEAVVSIVRALAPRTLIVSGNGLATELKMGLFEYIPELDGVAHSEGDDVIVKIAYDAAMVKKYGWSSAVARGELAPYYQGENAHGRHRLLYAGARPRSDKKGVLPNMPWADLGLMDQDVFGRSPRQMIMDTPAWHATAGTSSAVPWNIEDLIPKINTVSSRGCPFSCYYCYRGAQGETLWGVRSAFDLAEQILYYRERHNIRFVAYPDDNFAVAIPRIEEMVPLFKDIVSMGIRWGTHTRMDEGADARRIKPMADAGCVYIGFGPESANRDTLEAINKGGHTLSIGFEGVRVDGRPWEFPRSMTVSMRNCINYGIHANCTWIMGSPGETVARLKDSVAFIRWQEQLYELHDSPAASVNKRMFTMTWYPGTKLIKHPKVRQELNRVFGLNFDPNTFEPVMDDAFYRYCLELDDATKVLEGPNGEPLNFSDMTTDEFLQAREHVDSGDIFKILEM